MRPSTLLWFFPTISAVPDIVLITQFLSPINSQLQKVVWAVNGHTWRRMSLHLTLRWSKWSQIALTLSSSGSFSWTCIIVCWMSWFWILFDLWIFLTPGFECQWLRLFLSQFYNLALAYSACQQLLDGLPDLKHAYFGFCYKQWEETEKESPISKNLANGRIMTSTSGDIFYFFFILLLSTFDSTQFFNWYINKKSVGHAIKRCVLTFTCCP